MEAADRPATVAAACVVLYVLAANAIVFNIAEVVARKEPWLLAASVFGGAIIATLGYFCGKGKNPARIIVWIFASIQVLNSIILIPSALRRFAEPPAWHGHMRLADLIIVLVGIVGAAVLLGLPRSRPFFRRAPSVTPTG